MIGASTLALMGLGMTGELAGVIGADFQLAVGKGTTQVTGQVLNGDNVEVTTTGGQTAIVCPTVQAVAEPIFIFNSSPTASSALLFVPLTHAMNGSTTVPLTIPQNKAAIVWQYKPKFWVSILTA